MLRIVMDSAGDILPEWLQKFKIHVIPINIHFGEKTFLQGVDLSNEAFYQLVEQSGSIPKTSQPTPQQFIDFYRKIAQHGETILSVHVTSKLSGTFESAVIAARELAGELRVIPFDSGGGSAGIGYMCREARELALQNLPLDRIVDHLTQIRAKTEIILTLDTLKYARMSGRVRAMQAALASALNVKPIIELKDGVLDMSEKVRTRRKSIERVIQKMQDKFGDCPVNIAVVYARDLPSGQEMLARVKNSFNIKQLILTELSTGIAANLGPGTIGLVAYPELER